MFSERVRELWNSQNAARPLGDAPPRRDWFLFENKADSTDLYIFDAIYPNDGFGGGVGAADFQEQLNAVKSKQINLFLNSPGGLVHEGVTIFNALKAHPATVNVTVQGIAASIASVIAQAGDTIQMAGGSMMMIHQAYGMTLGNASDMRKMAEALDKMTSSIAGIYASRSGKDTSHWLGLMAAETWFSDQEAVVAGLADSVVGAKPSASTPKAQLEETQPDAGTAARRQLAAAAYLEVIHAYAH